MSRREEYIEGLKRQLDELNSRLDELDARTEEAGAEAKAKFNEQIGELRAYYQAAQSKLTEAKSASEDKWEALVAEGEKVHKAFVHSFNYFKSQLKD